MREKNKSIFASLEDLKKLINEDEPFDSSRANSLLTELEKQVQTNTKERKGLNNLLLLCLAIITLITSYAFYQRDENSIQSTKIKSLERIDSIYNTFMQPFEGSISYRVDGEGNPISYRALMAETDSMRQKNYEMERKLYDYEFELNFIKEHYPITVIRKGNTYTIKSEQIDSALMLLQVYRDRLYFDKEENSWMIK